LLTQPHLVPDVVVRQQRRGLWFFRDRGVQRRARVLLAHQAVARVANGPVVVFKLL